MPPPDSLSLAILIPCLNEAPAIAGVVREYRAAFPNARIVVVDNGSSDRTGEIAMAAGAELISEPVRGKARAVLAAWSVLNEDLVLMVDGDGSYPAEGGRALLELFRRAPADLISGIRTPASNEEPNSSQPFRPMHQFGTRLFERFLSITFGYQTADLFSGLRLFTRRFYKNVPILSRGFELEIELTIQAIDKSFSLKEIPVPFRDRTAGTASKLHTLRDGWRILRALFVLLRDYKPFWFFSRIAAVTLFLGLLAGWLPVREYFETHLVGRFPLAILAASLVSLSTIVFLAGLMMESNLRHHRESYQIRMRNLPPAGPNHRKVD